MPDECLNDIGPTCGDGTTCGHSHPSPLTTGGATSSRVATLARPTASQAGLGEVARRVSAVTSSALLMHFGLALFYEKTRVRERMLPGLGGECGVSWSRLVTLCCPSDCERVALGLTANGTGCSCSPNWYAPTATDWKGGTKAERKDGGNRGQFRHQYTRRTGYLYPDPAVMEAVLGFPAGWTECEPSGTPARQCSPSGSDDAS